jgi:CO/xanthine dehydrogenase FAD-binding subunit
MDEGERGSEPGEARRTLMMNTHILCHEFEYFEPKTVEEAAYLMATCSDQARVIAGGTDLLVQMKTGKVFPESLINISRIPALRYLIAERGLRLGALTTFRDLERSATVRERYTALYEAARSISSVQIKNMGTVGGNLCHASPAADSAPPLIALGGTVRAVGKSEERSLPLETFFVGPGKTALDRREILAEVELPELPAQTGSAFLKMVRVSADLAKVSVAAAIVRDDDICSYCRIVLGAVAKTPLRAKRAEAALMGKRFSSDLLKKASEEASEEIDPIDDVRSTAWYRREVSKVLVRDAVNLAWSRAGERKSP